VYAPGLTTGYACWPLPGVRQAILENDGPRLDAAVPALIDRIDAAAEALRTAAREARDALAPAPEAGAGALPEGRRP
jgi:N-acetylated-alpha-linked acidic dipeptidase